MARDSGLFTLKEFYNRGVIKMAPDVLVYIGGSLTTKVVAPVSGRDSNLSFNDGITTVNVQNNMDPPGSSTASIEITTPIYGENSNYWVHYEGIDSSTPVRAPLFIPMMEVKIYFKGRFMVKDQPRYYPAFWGFITNVEENYSGGVYKINLTCADVLHWWAYSTINVHPVPASNIAASGGQSLTIFSTVFNRKNPFQIMYQLTTNMGMHEFVTAAWLAQKTPLATIYPPKQFKEHAIGPNGIMSYWRKRLGNMTNLLKMFGMDGKRVNLNGVEVIRPVASVAKKGKKSQNQQALEGKDDRELVIDYNFITKFETFADYGDLGTFENAEYMTKLQIATEIKNKIDFEFFQDVDGNWIFKPPFYNLNVRGIQPYTILPSDVLSYSVNTDTEGIITVLTVNTPMNKNLRTTSFAKGVGFHMDIDLSKRFGVRHQQVTLEYVNNSTLARSLALGQMNIMNAKVVTGSVTVPGRPEMRLGYPIYLEHRDSFHYVRSINHSFDYGGSFTTTFSLQTERRKVWYENDQKKWALHIDKVYRYVPDKKIADTAKPDKTIDKPLPKGDPTPKRVCTDPNKEEGPPQITVTDKVEKDQMKLLEGQRRIVSQKQGRYDLSSRIKDDPKREERVVTTTTAPYTDEYGYQVFGSFPYGRDLNPIMIAPNIDSTSNVKLPVMKEVYLTTMARPLASHESKNMDILFFKDREGAAPLYLNTENKMPQILGVIADTTSVLDCISPNQNESKVENTDKSEHNASITVEMKGPDGGSLEKTSARLTENINEENEVLIDRLRGIDEGAVDPGTGRLSSPSFEGDLSATSEDYDREIAELERQLTELEG